MPLGSGFGVSLRLAANYAHRNVVEEHIASASSISSSRIDRETNNNQIGSLAPRPQARRELQE
jgi:hypothetical protein